MFGPAVTMTADAPVSAVLRDLGADKWINHDTEVETGCGIVPYRYRAGNYVHALQWGIGLELFLLGQEPWQVMLSTDHPNGGSFLSYPKLIRLLMDRAFREDQMARANQRAIRRTALHRRARPRVHAERDRDHHPRGAGPPPRSARQGPPRRRRRRRRDDLPRSRRPRGDVRHPALRDQGRRSWSSRTASCAAPTTGCCSRAAPRFDPEREPRARAAVRRPLHGGVRALPGPRPGAARAGARGGGRRLMTGYTLGDAEVADTFAEAFPMRFARDGDHGGHRRTGRSRRRARRPALPRR